MVARLGVTCSIHSSLIQPHLSLECLELHEIVHVLRAGDGHLIATESHAGLGKLMPAKCSFSR